MKKITVIVLLFALFVACIPVMAQNSAPYVVRSTQPISDELRASLNAWLATDAPSTAPYYIVTNARIDGETTIVSLAGVNLSSPDAKWRFEDNSSVWIGSVVVNADRSVSPLVVNSASVPGVGTLAGLPMGKPLYSLLPRPHYSEQLLTWNGTTMTATASSYYGNDSHYVAANAFNGSGLSSGQHDAHTFGYNEWLSNTNDVANAWLQIDLGASYTISKMHVWNFNQPGYTGRGISQADILYKVNSGDSWTTYANDASFTQASGASTYTGFDYAFSGNITARYIRIEADTNFDSSANVGIAEIQFYEYIPPTNTPTLTPTATATDTPTPTFTPTITNTPTETFTPTVTYTPSPGPTPSNTPPPPPPTNTPLAGVGGSIGGGSYLMFPFATGTAAQYGPRGVHAAGYGTDGMKAVDLVGGDAMGSSSMPPKAFAADAGTVDYVCNDGTSVAVRTYNSSTGDYFIYAHMLNNSNLVEGHAFSRGSSMGSLKYGTFDDTCGWGSQADNQYHLHWGFVPKGGAFQVGSCILTISTQKWSCGSNTVSIGGFLTGGGGYTGGSGDASGVSGAGETVTDPTFFDYVLTGFLTLVDQGILKLLPSHNAFEYTYLLFNTVTVVMKIIWVLVASNINLGPLAAVLLLGITIRLAFSVAWLAAFLLKAWKSLVPVLGA